MLRRRFSFTAHLRVAALTVGVTASVATASLCFADSGPVDDEAVSGDEDDDRLAAPSEPPLVSFGIGIGSLRLGDSDGLAFFASRNQLGELSRFASVFEPTLTLMLDRFVLPLRMRMASTSSIGGLRVDSTGGSFGAGYQALRRPNLVVYPSLSLGIVQTSLSIGESQGVAGVATFEKLAESPGSATLTSVTVTGEASLDAQFRLFGEDKVEPRGFFLGGRFGITAPLARGDWALAHRPPYEATVAGPAAPVAGPLLAVTLTARY